MDCGDPPPGVSLRVRITIVNTYDGIVIVKKCEYYNNYYN